MSAAAQRPRMGQIVTLWESVERVGTPEEVARTLHFQEARRAPKCP